MNNEGALTDEQAGMKTQSEFRFWRKIGTEYKGNEHNVSLIIDENESRLAYRAPHTQVPHYLPPQSWISNFHGGFLLPKRSIHFKTKISLLSRFPAKPFRQPVMDCCCQIYSLTTEASHFLRDYCRIRESFVSSE